MSERQANIESDLAALADGSLAPEQRKRALERIGADPRHARELEVQRRAVELVRSVQVTAPTSLHRQLSNAQRPTSQTRRPRARVIAPAGLAVTFAAVLAIVIAGVSGSRQTPSFAKISALTLAHSTMAAARENPANQSQLEISVGGVAFPYWSERFDWQATGMRVDRIAGRAVTTVFYESPQHRRIGYAIVAGKLGPPQTGRVSWRGGVQYRLLRSHSAETVTWQRGGHLCVVSGRGVSSRVLLALASWDDRGQSV
jgi:anti-sigma factor RsiW